MEEWEGMDDESTAQQSEPSVAVRGEKKMSIDNYRSLRTQGLFFR